MGRSLTVTDSYNDAGQTVEITQQLTERQFQEIERILDRPRERFKVVARQVCIRPRVEADCSTVRSPPRGCRQ